MKTVSVLSCICKISDILTKGISDKNWYHIQLFLSPLKIVNGNKPLKLSEKHALLVSLLVDVLLSTTIEERVAFLEIQVADIEGDISILIENGNFLFGEQIIQDQRLFSLEQGTGEIEEQLIMVDDDLEVGL